MSWVAGRQQRVNKLVGTGSLRHTLLKPLNNYEPPDSEGHEPLLHLQVESKLFNKGNFINRDGVPLIFSVCSYDLFAVVEPSVRQRSSII